MLHSHPTHGMRWLPVVIVVAVGMMSVLASCEEERKSYVKNVGDGEHTPTMNTLNVHTFISDSGYTKYYITAPIWSMYEEAKDPFWLFPKGVDLEQYDNNLKVVSTMRCDSARYFSQRRIWRLDGHVMMVNTRNDTFLTQQLFWNQAKREVYTDSFIHIVRDNRVIEGMGFTSNERMTSYTVKRPMGIFPVDRRPGESSPNTANADEPQEVDRQRSLTPERASRRNPQPFDALPLSQDTSRFKPVKKME